MVTKVAMIMIKAGILVSFGITFLSSEIITFEKSNTKVTASHIPIPLVAEVVNASVGQVPSNNLKVGLFVIKPSLAVLKSLFILTPYFRLYKFNSSNNSVVYCSRRARSAGNLHIVDNADV